MKSYAVNGFSSIEEGVEYHLQGYSQYKPNKSSDEIKTFGNISYDYEIDMTIAALVTFSLSSYSLGLILIAMKYYDKCCEMCNQPKTDNQRFRFKSIFWAAILTITFLDCLAFRFGIPHIFEFGLMWKNKYQFIYRIVIAMIVFYGVLSLTFSLVIVCYKHWPVIYGVLRLMFSLVIACYKMHWPGHKHSDDEASEHPSNDAVGNDSEMISLVAPTIDTNQNESESSFQPVGNQIELILPETPCTQENQASSTQENQASSTQENQASSTQENQASSTQENQASSTQENQASSTTQNNQASCKLSRIVILLQCLAQIWAVFAQIWAVYAVTIMTVILPVLLYGLMLGLLVNPEQIFAWIVLLLLGSLISIIFLASLIDKVIDIKTDKSKNHSIKTCLKKFLYSIFYIIGFVLIAPTFIASIIMFSVVYIRVIIFTGVDNTGTVSSAGQLFPSLFLAFLLWRIKKEYDKFNKKSKNEAEAVSTDNNST
jgi:hypothetical protein